MTRSNAARAVDAGVGVTEHLQLGRRGTVASINRRTTSVSPLRLARSSAVSSSGPDGVEVRRRGR